MSQKYMSKTPILLLVSKEFPLDVLNNSPRFLAYSFYSVAAIQYLEKIVEQGNNNYLLDILCDQIRTILPKYLIVHCGLAFTHYPFEFLDSVLEIKKIFPDLNIAMDRSFESIDLHLNAIRNSTDSVFVLRNRLTQNRSLFYLDEEVRLLISCLR